MSFLASFFSFFISILFRNFLYANIRNYSLFIALSILFFVFDAAGQRAVRLILKTWVKQAGIRDVGAYFSVKDAKRELEPWSPLFSVSSRGYMLGYQSLHDPAFQMCIRDRRKGAEGKQTQLPVREEHGRKYHHRHRQIGQPFRQGVGQQKFHALDAAVSAGRSSLRLPAWAGR